MSADDIEETVRSDPRGDDEWMEYMLDGYASCNGLTIDDLQRALIGGGLFVGKCELLANAFHLDEAVQHYPLSSLGISGVKLLAARR